MRKGKLMEMISFLNLFFFYIFGQANIRLSETVPTDKGDLLRQVNHRFDILFDTPLLITPSNPQKFELADLGSGADDYHLHVGVQLELVLLKK